MPLSLSLPKNYLKDAYGVAGATSADPKSQFVSNVANSPSPYGMSTVNGPVYYNIPGSTSAPSVASSAPSSSIYGGQPNTPSGAVVGAAGNMISGPTVKLPSEPTRTPAGTTSAPVNTDAYRKSFESYLGTLQVSPEEKAAKDYLNSLLGTATKEEERALGMGETLGFATGEAARVGRQRAGDISAASRALEALSGYRAASGETAKARAEFEKGLLDLENKSRGEGFELSEGQARYDASGNLIAERAKTATTEDPLDAAYKRAQIANIQSQIDERKRGSSGQYQMPKTQRNNILKYGLSETDVNALEKDIQLYGLDKALEGVDESLRSRVIEALQVGY